MDVDDVKKALGRPNLNYEKDYKSEGKLSENGEYIEPVTPPVEPEKPEDIIEDIKKLKYFVPDDIKSLLYPVINSIEDIITKITDKTGDVPSDITVVPSDNGNSGDNDNNNNNGDETFSEIIDPIDYFVDSSPEYTKFETKYFNTIKDITNDYLQDVQDILGRYISYIMTYISESYLSYKDLTDTSQSIFLNKDPDKTHLKDTIIREEIERDQKVRLYNKIYNDREIKSVITSCDSAISLYIRYLKEKYQDENTNLQAKSNMILSQDCSLYEKKYYRSLKNFYKYLNGSSLALSDCLKSYETEADAKAMLKK